MVIGIVSDTHNNLKNIDKIITLFNQIKVDLVIHTGDITNMISLKKFSSLNCKMFGVFGNNDRNETGLKEYVKKNCLDIQEPPVLRKLHNRNIAVFHEPDLIEDYLTYNKKIDIIVHGHTHRYREEIINNTLLFNPGESAGMSEGKNAIGIINLKDLSTKRIFF